MARDFHEALAAAPWVIVGCGYSGERLAARVLREGGTVTVTRRSEAEAHAVSSRLGGGEAVALDLREPGSLSSLAEAISPGAIVVDSVPPGDDGGEGERSLARACAKARARRLVYLSSTGVYGPGEGAWVDEDTPTGPASERGRRRLTAESAVLDEAAARGLSAVAIRIAAIYGPGRGVHERLRAGTYRIVGAGDAYVSRVHVDDLVAAILAAGTADALSRQVYTLADDTPMPSRRFAEEVAKIMDLAPPPAVPAEDVDPGVRAMFAADRKVSSRRLQEELGLRLRYPNGLDGVRAALAAALASSARRPA